MADSPVYVPSDWGNTFHSRTENEVLGAGSAGPGKSTVLRWDPWTQINVEHQRCHDRRHPFHIKWGESKGHALYLTRISNTLENSVDKAKVEFPKVYPGAVWRESDMQFKFPSGFKYSFGHCKDPDDWQNYQSQEYCVARGTRVVMGDDSLKEIQDIQIGDSVMTLEGPRTVTHTWATGERPCVEAVVRVHDAIVGRQTHPSTHPVLLSSTVALRNAPSQNIHQSDGRCHPNGWTWQDYESLLCGRPASPVWRASLIDGRSGTEVCCGLRLGEQPLPRLIVPVVLHERSSRRARDRWLQARGYHGLEQSLERSARTPPDPEQHQQCGPSDLPPAGEDGQPGPFGGEKNLSCDDACDRLGSQKATDFQENYSSSRGLHDAPVRPDGDGDLETTRPRDDAEIRIPTRFHGDDPEHTQANSPHISPFYPHFYTGEPRPLTEGVRMGSMSLEFVGWRETFDLTVDGANHYITESGLIQAQTRILYDELVHFTEEQYRQINTRLRTDDPVLIQMLGIRAMSNPMMRKGGQVFTTRGDPHWVRKRFVDPFPLGKKVLVEETERSDGSKVRWTRLYLPATLFDNPNKEFVAKYEADLLFSPPHIRQALLYGNWYITEGSYYASVWDQSLHVCRPFKVPTSWRMFRAMDWGFKVPGVIGWFAMDDDENLFMVREYKFQNRTDAEVGKRIKEIEIELGVWSGTKERPGKKSLLTGPADTQIWEQRGHQGKTIAETFNALGIQWVPADKKAGSREAHAQRIHKLLGDHHGGTTTPGLVFFQGCDEIIRTLPQIQAEEGNPECPQDGGDDHAHDCVSGDTLVTTNRGLVPIRHLESTDLVLSTDGQFWPCTGGRMVRRNTLYAVRLDGWATLQATADHLILCSDGTWRRVDQLDTSCYAFSPWIRSSSAPRVKNFKASAITFAAGISAGLLNISPAAYCCIAMFFLQTEAFYWLGTMSTIETMTGQITPWRIWSSFLLWFMSLAILAKTETDRGASPSRSLGKQKPRSGTPAPPGEPGTPRTPRRTPGELDLAGMLFASNAGISSRISQFRNEASTALERAPQRPGGTAGSTTRPACALPVGVNSWSTGTVVSDIVPGSAHRVLGVEPLGEEETWCTTVPVMGAFVANGIVISNCLGYACAFASRGKRGIPPLKHDDEWDDPDMEPEKSRGKLGYGGML